jgi:hypothetical protein
VSAWSTWLDNHQRHIRFSTSYEQQVFEFFEAEAFSLHMSLMITVEFVSSWTMSVPTTTYITKLPVSLAVAENTVLVNRGSSQRTES